MISRRSTLFIAELYVLFFSNYRKEFPNEFSITTLKKDELWNYFYAKEYDVWFLTEIYHLNPEEPNSLREFILLLHTGETVRTSERRNVGQECLRQLAQDLLEITTQDIDEEEEDPDNLSKAASEGTKELIAQLELDGYIFKDGRLYLVESSVIDVQAEQGYLASLVDSFPLADPATIKHHINRAEEHYVNGKWDDSIGNSRKFLDAILNQVAERVYLKVNNKPIPLQMLKNATDVRIFLEKQKLISAIERETLDKTYGLLSSTGGHPYIAQNDQSRLMWHLALTFSQFVLLRYEGFLKNHP
jgi:hypothetical protein